jgi:hypothetical protein
MYCMGLMLLSGSTRGRVPSFCALNFRLPRARGPPGWLCRGIGLPPAVAAALAGSYAVADQRGKPRRNGVILYRGGSGRGSVLSIANGVDRPDFDQLHRDERLVDGAPALTPWDIGGPQPVVKQLVAFGGLRGEVLDPGTGPGHHAIHYASQGYSATGIDSSPAGIDRM